MPAPTRRRRRPSRARTAPAPLIGLVGLVLLAGAAGCGVAADAGQSSGNQELIADLASRLTGAAAETYTATYTIGGGVSGTIAQAPTRVAYTYPTGITVITPQGATQCDRGIAQITCTHSPAAAVMARAIEQGGLIRPETVITMLTGAAMDADAIISENDTSFAGVPATCITITYPSGPAGFDACVTSTGLLGSFNGTADGAHIDMTLNRVDLTVADDAFTLPAGAKIVGASPSP